MHFIYSRYDHWCHLVGDDGLGFAGVDADSVEGGGAQRPAVCHVAAVATVTKGRRNTLWRCAGRRPHAPQAAAKVSKRLKEQKKKRSKCFNPEKKSIIIKIIKS